MLDAIMRIWQADKYEQIVNSRALFSTQNNSVNSSSHSFKGELNPEDNMA